LAHETARGRLGSTPGETAAEDGTPPDPSQPATTELAGFPNGLICLHGELGLSFAIGLLGCSMSLSLLLELHATVEFPSLKLGRLARITSGAIQGKEVCCVRGPPRPNRNGLASPSSRFRKGTIMKMLRLATSISFQVMRLSELVLFGAASAATRSIADVPPEWPRIIFSEGRTNIIYQPQLQSWDYDTLKALCAVAVQPRGVEQPVFGTIQLTAQTRVDRAERTVLLEQLEITQGFFPGAAGQERAYLATIRSVLPADARSISLDRLEAELAIRQARKRSASQPLRNDPPVIIFCSAPALLVPIDGTPVYRPVEGTGLDRVFNTRALILRDASGRHYLHLFDGYVQSASLSGPWAAVSDPPMNLKKAEALAVESRQVDLLAGQENPDNGEKASLKSTPLPVLYVTSSPTELIVLHGEAQWVPLPATQLLYVTNTAAQVFKSRADQQIYLLISGRWFRGGSFQGPWEFVPGRNLPRDFTTIPDDSPKENAKAAVPGTHQALEALIANGIPSTVKVNRRTAAMDPPPQYDGSPELERIDGTTLQYVRDCATPVIRVDSRTWYACQNGVWFLSASSAGPWSVATSVPAMIYSIPPSSPVHYVVYSRTYRYDADSVWVGTTPGYYGTMVGPDGTVVFGTGYPYEPYVGETLFVSYPVTYGYGCEPCWTPWVGWSFGFASGWASGDDWYWWCACPPAPYWGPYWYPCYGSYYNAYGGITAWGPYGWAGTTGYIYHQEGPWTGVSRAAVGYNAWTGNAWATSYGRAYNSTTGTRVIGQRGAVENIYTGNYAYGGRGAFYNENTGAAGVGRKVTWGNEETGKQGSAGRGTVYNPETGQATHIAGIKGEDAGIVRVNDHVIASKDGNYYRPDGHGGWEEIPKPLKSTVTPRAADAMAGSHPNAQCQWNRMQPSLANQQQIQQLNNQANARQVGAQRQQSFQVNRPAFAGRPPRR
jgi:hypothetical protein